MHLIANRTLIASSAAIFAGAALLTFGVMAESLSRTIAGVAITISAALASSLRVVHRWITDTADERRALLDAQLRADDERAKLVAAQYALEAERKRIRIDAIAAGRRADEALQLQTAMLVQRFEEDRAGLAAESLEAALRMIVEGKLLEPGRPAARGRAVIPFPLQNPEHERTRDRDISS
ncbi:hypothetical protein ACFXKX_24090 [Streptomyces scopuliridis]|uniref:hypothetical protein n=1 Tax=Streptomyces scopuliridis TaxID=452529 RepID=UPI0036B47211